MQSAASLSTPCLPTVICTARAVQHLVWRRTNLVADFYTVWMKNVRPSIEIVALLCYALQIGNEVTDFSKHAVCLGR